jgi:hypothetical protein
MKLGKVGTAVVFSVLAGSAGLMAGASIASQPRMESALDHLNAAERDLQAATSDKGGHRNRALDLTRQAQAQVRKGMRYDRRN